MRAGSQGPARGGSPARARSREPARERVARQAERGFRLPRWSAPPVGKSRPGYAIRYRSRLRHRPNRIACAPGWGLVLLLTLRVRRCGAPARLRGGAPRRQHHRYYSD